MASTTASTAAAPQSTFIFTVQWNVPPCLISTVYPNLWSNTTVAISHSASIEEVRKRISEWTRYNLEQHESYSVNNLPAFMNHLISNHDNDPTQPCRMVRFHISLTSSGGPGNAPSNTIDLDSGMWKRFESICDLTHHPDELKQKRLILHVQLAIDRCYPGTTPQTGEFLDRFIHSGSAQFKYVAIGTVQNDQAPRVDLMKTPQTEPADTRKNVIVTRLKETKLDGEDFEDEVRLLNTWLLGEYTNRFLVGDCDGGDAMQLTDLTTNSILVSGWYQDKILKPGNRTKTGQNPSLANLKTKVSKKIGWKMQIPPRLPPLSMNSFNPVQTTPYDEVKEMCRAAIRVVYLLPNTQLSDRERRCPQYHLITVDKNTTVQYLQDTLTRNYPDPLEHLAKGQTLPQGYQHTWWIMEDGADMGKMYQIGNQVPLVNFIDPERGSVDPYGDLNTLYLECHIRESTAPGTYLTQDGN